MTEGKKEFYGKVEEALKSKGYNYYDGDRDIPGKGRQHANKPDYIAVKDNKVYIGEIKSPAEGPKSSSWRQVQNSDTKEFAAVRTAVAKREKVGLLSTEIGGHIIIIEGQIMDYVRKIGVNYDLPVSVPRNAEIRMAYSMPVSEEQAVTKALQNCKKRVYKKINTGNGSVTYLFS